MLDRSANPFSDDDNLPSSIQRLGNKKDLRVYSTGDAETKYVAVIDIGSNSVKIVIYDTDHSIPIEIARHSMQCRLGKGMVTGDKNPRLNPDGIKLIKKTLLPEWQKMIGKLKVKPTRYIVMATEAPRAAIGNKRDPQQAKIARDFLVHFAAELGLPTEAVNILTEEQEGCLAGQAMLCGGHEGFGIMVGGNSCEFVEVKDKKILHHRTLRFGMNSLQAMKIEDAKAEITKHLNSVSFFKDPHGPDADRRTTSLCLLGGAARAAGREGAQIINHIPFTAKMPFGGYVFSGGGKFNEFLVHLEKTSHAKQLAKDAFGKSIKEINRHGRKIDREPYVPIMQRNKSGDLTKTWVKQDDFDDMCKQWEEKIGSRADQFPALSLVLQEAERRLRPFDITFSPHNLREGSLRYTRLGYT